MAPKKEGRRYLVSWIEFGRKDRRPFLWVTSEEGLEQLRRQERLGKVRILEVIRV